MIWHLDALRALKSRKRDAGAFNVPSEGVRWRVSSYPICVDACTPTYSKLLRQAGEDRMTQDSVTKSWWQNPLHYALYSGLSDLHCLNRLMIHITIKLYYIVGNLVISLITQDITKIGVTTFWWQYFDCVTKGVTTGGKKRWLLDFGSGIEKISPLESTTDVDGSLWFYIFDVLLSVVTLSGDTIPICWWHQWNST